MESNRNIELPLPMSVRGEVIQVLLAHLGITKTAFFIRDALSQRTDYLVIKNQLFGNQNAEQIYQSVQKWLAGKENDPSK